MSWIWDGINPVNLTFSTLLKPKTVKLQSTCILADRTHHVLSQAFSAVPHPAHRPYGHRVEVAGVGLQPQALGFQMDQAFSLGRSGGKDEMTDRWY